MFEWGIESLTFSGNEHVLIDHTSTLILVGPNSSGKSTALNDVINILGGGTSANKALTNGKLFLNGTEQEFRIWLEQKFPSRIIGEMSSTQYISRGDRLYDTEIANMWAGLSREGHGYGSNAQFLLQFLDTASRLSLADKKPSIDLYGDPPTEYIHLLQLNEALRKSISSEVRKAFNTDLIINWWAGKDVWFHVGDAPTDVVDRLDNHYMQYVNLLPRLERAGDGIRSFIGILLAARCGAQRVLLVDEPEAFLHQKQAERIGSILASSAEEGNRQVIIATHSSAIVRGAISASSKVAVCRVTRENNVNHGSLLSSAQLKKLWEKPILKSTAAIAGIFYEAVVVTEADGDSRFYEALLSRLEVQQKLDSPADLYFVNGAGKGQLAHLAGAYNSLNVKVVVVADIDLLRGEAEFKSVTEALNGNFAEIDSLFQNVQAALNGLPALKQDQDFLLEAQDILDSALQNGFHKEHKRDLKTLLEQTKNWSRVKRNGIFTLPQDQKEEALQLLNWCKDIGLFVVPYGELESWWTDGPRKDNRWLEQALDEISANTDSFPEASSFVDEIFSYLSHD